jgi:hypothetical protein
MIFTASVRPGSSIDRMWREHRRLRGHIYGVTFTLTDGRYVAEELHETDISLLAGHVCVEVVAMGIDPETAPELPEDAPPTPSGLTAGPEFRARHRPGKKGDR